MGALPEEQFLELLRGIGGDRCTTLLHHARLHDVSSPPGRAVVNDLENVLVDLDVVHDQPDDDADRPRDDRSQEHPGAGPDRQVQVAAG